MEAASGIFLFEKNDITLTDNYQDQPEKDKDEKDEYNKEVSMLPSPYFDILYEKNQSYSTFIHNRLSDPYLSITLRPPQVD